MMGLGLPLFFLALAALVAMQLLTQKANLASLAGPVPARQIAYNLRVFHQAAITYKLANPTVTGVLPVTPPAFLTDWRFTSCASSNAVVTSGSGFNLAMSRVLNDELLRQSSAPPELGIAAAPGGFTDGIGLSDGVFINNGFGPISPACPVPQGSAAIQTQVLP
jgi:hypothetical protein